ncbi:MAG: DUF2231 domain-containing protein [Thermoanaerobaculales bacterium]
MFEFLTAMTSLPNIHPAVVHFPVALALTALAVEVVSLILKRQAWLERSAALLYALAAAGAGVAYLAGRQAADTIGVIPAKAEAALSNHADLALWTLVVLGIAAAARVFASVGDQDRASSRFVALRATALLALLVSVGLITRTADLGGALVYRHGVAVVRDEPQAPSETAKPAAEPVVEVDFGSRLSQGGDGDLEWRPLPIDLAALGVLITPAPGSDPASVSAVADPAGSSGLALAVDGASLLVLPETFGDVVIEAEVDVSGFQGTVGLAHHVAAADVAVLFTVSTDGETSLLRRNGGEVEVFDNANVSAPTSSLTLQSSVAGKHLKGFVDGEMVVHGHGGSGAPGSVGLMVDGKGTIRVIRVAVTPVGDD